MTRFTRPFSPLFWAVACAGWTLGCSDGGLSIPDLSAQHPGNPPEPPVNTGPQNPPIEAPSLVCKPDIVVNPNSRAMVVTDPEVLARFSLERVLQQIIDRANFGNTTTLQMMQQLFDTQNSEATGVFPDVVHCDDPENDAFNVAPAKFCPRAEGKLATSTGFFQANHPDSFVPIALVNRFDLTPREGNNCGEHRIMFAKLSGQTNPNERVFLAFEGIIENPTFGDTLIGCRPVAEMWASLEKRPTPRSLPIVWKSSISRASITSIRSFRRTITPWRMPATMTEVEDMAIRVRAAVNCGSVKACRSLGSSVNSTSNSHSTEKPARPCFLRR